MKSYSRNRAAPLFLLAAVLAAAATVAVTVYGLRRAAESVAPPMDTSLRGSLSQAEWVQVFRVQPKIEIPVTKFGPGADESPAMFALLKEGTRFGAGKPPGETDLVFSIRSRAAGAEHGRVTRFIYDLETGRIGNGNEWGAAPEEFRWWIRRMDARVPKKEYGITRVEGRKVVTPMPDRPGE